jgi:hypothetical protein
MRKGKDLADRSSRFGNPSPNQYTDQVLLDALNIKKVRTFGALGNMAGRGNPLSPESIRGVGNGVPFPYNEDQYSVTGYVINTN